MKLRHYIALDLAVSHTTLEAQTRGGQVVRRLDLATETRALIGAVKEIRRSQDKAVRSLVDSGMGVPWR